MIGAWGLVIPFGLTVAIMCKAVCPGKKFIIVRSALWNTLSINLNFFANLPSLYALKIALKFAL